MNQPGHRPRHAADKSHRIVSELSEEWRQRVRPGGQPEALTSSDSELCREPGLIPAFNVLTLTVSEMALDQVFCGTRWNRTTDLCIYQY